MNDLLWIIVLIAVLVCSFWGGYQIKEKEALKPVPSLNDLIFLFGEINEKLDRLILLQGDRVEGVEMNSDIDMRTRPYNMEGDFGK